MQLVAYDEKSKDVTFKLTHDEFSTISACLSYMASTFDDQDSVFLGLPGEQGEALVLATSNAVQEIVKELCRLTIPGYTE